MASGTDLQTLREDITCSICIEPMTEPVSIDCGHSYCRSCIMRILENPSLESAGTGVFHCPVCRAEFRQKSIRPMKQLENLINVVKKMEQERLCEQHGERLHLFCEDDDQFICWRCERSPQHKGHFTVLVEDAGLDYKEKFQSSLMELRKLQDKNMQWLVNTKHKIRNWGFKTSYEELQIEDNFSHFDMILREEKKSCLWQLEKVKQDVLQRLWDSAAKLEKQNQELSDHILELERKCQDPAQGLLQDLRDTCNRISALKLHEPEDVSLDIDIMHNVPGCFSKLREALEAYKVVITLDSDTAHKDLCVPGKQKRGSWRCQEKEDYTPARFRDLHCVLSQQIFASGSHFFQVFVINGPEWDVGVCLENVPRDNDTRNPESGFWAIRRSKENHYEALTSPPTPLHIQKEIEYMRVFLNYENGLVSFYAFRDDSHLFTFPKASFSGPLRAYFRVGEDSLIKP